MQAIERASCGRSVMIRTATLNDLNKIYTNKGFGSIRTNRQGNEMKNVKKFMSLMIAVVMMMAMTVTTFAASITLNSTQEDEGENTTEYTYYQVMIADLSGLTDDDYNSDGSPKEDAKVVYYVETEALATALEETGMFTVTKVVGEDRWNIELKTEGTTGEALATALNVDAVKNAAIASDTFSMNGNTATVQVDPGYYLITASNGTKLALQTLADVTIDEKNTYPTLTKTEDSTTLSIGQTETYTIKVNIPANVAEKDIVVVDTITKGLTLNTAITVTGAADSLTSLTFVEDTEYVADPAGSAKQYRATIDKTNVLANKGKTLILTYTAVVNTDAVVYNADTNTAHLEYDNYKSVDVETVKVTTYGFEVDKVDKDEATITTDDAEFSLWDAAEGGNQIAVVKVEGNTYRVALSTETGVAITAGKSGKATVNGLAAGTYYLQEDKAPKGYNQLTAREKVVLAEGATAAVDVQVINNAGTTLPSTGGIGTTLFYVIGAVLVLGSGVLMVSKKRMGAN